MEKEATEAAEQLHSKSCRASRPSCTHGQTDRQTDKGLKAAEWTGRAEWGAGQAADVVRQLAAWKLKESLLNSLREQSA